MIAFLNEGKIPKITARNKTDNNEPVFAPLTSDDAAKILPSGDFEVTMKGDSKSFPIHPSKPTCDTQKIDSKSKRSKDEKAKNKRYKAKLDRLKSLAEKRGISYETILEEYRNRRAIRLQKNKPIELEEFFSRIKPRDQAKHFIEVRLVRSSPESDQLKATFDQSFKVYKSYQVKIHKDDPDEISESSFRNFLVSSPLVDFNCKSSEPSDAPQFGSYHQQYWLDGKQLIAVGVVDLLPGYLSAVYFYYNPAYNFLQLGVFSALKEIEFVRELARKYGKNEPRYANFKQYCMGYYIHSCVKMRYKGRYKPSFLSCPETYRQVPIADCIKMLEKNGKYSRFSDVGATDPDSIEDLPSSQIEQRLMMRIRGPKNKNPPAYRVLPFSELKAYLSRTDEILTWAKLVGVSALDGRVLIDLS
ncbi:Arginyl-tRNA--protein transferase 1 [Cichlidogyrus casuarinus]|uniref:Arginyl-tRNA--protein transferase 1 n=1 Tax=Cichlidogyrus casuarinus TaxID=1844966 RepID=A0ABD2PYW3_9PLAT